MPAADTVLQGRYRIVRQLGKGGMGAVYEAVDERLHRTVALKETLADTEELKRAFEREARLLANLRHPVLPKVIDHFTEDDGQFLVMEFIPGSDLGELLSRRSRPFSPSEVRRWADDLLDALDYLHTHEPPIIHRDLKPANLKLTAQGKVVLLDFGLAKGVAGQMTRTSSGLSVVGYTLNYAALEQIQGERTSPRSDLYSLAATLYHLLTNRAPEDALKRAADLLDDKEDPLPAAHAVNADVPEEFSNLLMSALSLKPSRRPANAAEMRAALAEKPQAAFAHAVPVEDDELTRVTTPPAPRSGRLPAIGIGGDPTMVLAPTAAARPARPNNGGGAAVAAADRAIPERRSRAKKWWLIGGGIALALAMAVAVLLLWRASGKRPVTPATAPTAYDAVPAPFRDALPSVVGVTMQDASGRVTRQASGFFFKSDELVTALPVIEGATRGSVTFVGQTNALEVTSVTGVDRAHGLVTLRVARARAPGLALGNRKDTTLNDKVAVVGAGTKAEAAYAPGTISGYGDEDRIEVNAQAAQGMAGAPLLNAQGEVIGVVVETGSGRAVAASAGNLADLLRGKQQPMSLALAAAKDVFYDWRKHDPLPRPTLDKAVEERIITAVARAHEEKSPQPQPTASPEASPQAEGGGQEGGGGSLWDKLQGEMSNATVSAVAEGSFTAAGAKETAYIIDTHSGGPADNDGPKYLAIFSGETYVADYAVPNLSLVVRTFDLNRDNVNELLLGYYYMQAGQAMEWAKLVQVQQGQLRVVKDFGTTYFNACEAELENNPGLAASVVYVAPAANGQMPELRVDNYRAACPAEGSDAQWKYTNEAKLPDK